MTDLKEIVARALYESHHTSPFASQVECTWDHALEELPKAVTSYREDAEAILDALREAGALIEWQSIETVPKDGTIFIALTTNGLSTCRWEAVDWGDHPLDKTIYWWTDPNELLFFEDGPNSAPTHWMPLPNPPKEKS